jgi:hypothetical protein
VAVLFDVLIDPGLSGYDFDASSNVDTSQADVYVDSVGGIFYLNAGNILTDLQDMGFTSSFDDVGYAPQDGWSELGWVELIQGHTYVIWTDDLHFAKMRADTISYSSGWVKFQWAYQTDPENPELIARPDGHDKPIHGPEYLEKENTSSSLR